MIINGGSRSNWRFFAKHLVKTEENEHVHVVDIRGLAAENVMEAFREMDALASGTRCKNFFYHANINPRADEVLTPEQWDKAVDTLESNLGLEGHSRFVVEHEKEGRAHRHVIWSRIDTDSMTAVSDSKNYAAHEHTARALEEEFGHVVVQGAHGHDGKRPERGHDNWETFRGDRSGIDPKTVKVELSELWQQADSGKAFAAALDERGYVLCKGDRRDFCIVDAAGDAHSLARRLDGVKAAQVRERMADIDREGLPTVAEASQRVRLVEAEPEDPPAPPQDVPSAALSSTPAAVDPAVPMQRPSPSVTTSALEQFGQVVTQAMRENDGDPHINDGFTWLERSIITISEARDKVVDWAKGTWQDLVSRFGHDRDAHHDGHDIERDR